MKTTFPLQIVVRLGPTELVVLVFDLNDAARFGRRIELPLALAALGGEVPHQVLVGVAEDVVVLGAVLREIELGLLEDADQVGEAIPPSPALHRVCWGR